MYDRGLGILGVTGTLAMPFAYALALVVVITLLLWVLSLIFYADFKREIARRYPTDNPTHPCDRSSRDDLLAQYELGIWLLIAVVAASLIGLVAFLAYILL